jgi:hypothetical protein
MLSTLTGEQYSQKQKRLKFKNVIQSGKLFNTCGHGSRLQIRLPGLFVTVLIKNVSLTQKYLHVQVAKEDPQARIVGGRAVHDG